MRELIATGMIHNRVRMVVASFLCKHLLHYWQDSQREKFDVKGEYNQKWVPEWKTARYPKPIIEHASARVRALEAYKKGLMK